MMADGAGCLFLSQLSFDCFEEVEDHHHGTHSKKISFIDDLAHHNIQQLIQTLSLWWIKNTFVVRALLKEELSSMDSELNIFRMITNHQSKILKNVETFAFYWGLKALDDYIVDVQSLVGAKTIFRRAISIHLENFSVEGTGHRMAGSQLAQNIHHIYTHLLWTCQSMEFLDTNGPHTWEIRRPE